MKETTTLPIQISFDLSDFMFIKIDEHEISNDIINYAIVSQNGQPVRKGQFKGAYTQLRVTHLSSGRYNIIFSDRHENEKKFDFIKEADTADSYAVYQVE